MCAFCATVHNYNTYTMTAKPNPSDGGAHRIHGCSPRRTNIPPSKTRSLPKVTVSNTHINLYSPCVLPSRTLTSKRCI